MATKQTQEGLNSIIQAISNIVDQKVDGLKYDKTYRGIIKSGNVDEGYVVIINGSEYMIKSNKTFQNLDVVRIKAPLNNFSDIYIETVPMEDENILCFDTVHDMKQARFFREGLTVRTLGFYEVDDGGGAFYKIRKKATQETANEMDVILVRPETLVAELVKEDEILNVKQLGAKADGVTDVSSIINAFSNKYSLKFPAGTYSIQNDINIYYSLYGEGFSRTNHVADDKTWLLVKKSINIVGNAERIGQNINNINIKVDATNTNNIINFNPTTYSLLYGNNISIFGYQKIALNINITNQVTGTRIVYLNNIALWAKPSSDTTGLLIQGHATDLKVENFECMYSKIGIENHTALILNNAHIWNGENGTDINDWWSETRCIRNYGTILGSNIYLDSAYLIITNSGGMIKINGFYYWEDTSMNGSDKYDGYLVYAENIFDFQNVSINNCAIYAGKRLSHISCPLSNAKIIVDSEADFDRITSSANMEFISDDFYILNFSDETQTKTTYPCVAVIAQNADGNTELQLSFTGGENIHLFINKNYNDDVVIRGKYNQITKNCYYEIKNKKIYIYAERQASDALITSCNILSKSRYVFPYNMTSFVFQGNRRFRIPTKTTTSGLTKIIATQQT